MKYIPNPKDTLPESTVKICKCPHPECFGMYALQEEDLLRDSETVYNCVCKMIQMKLLNGDLHMLR